MIFESTVDGGGVGSGSSGRRTFRNGSAGVDSTIVFSPAGSSSFLSGSTDLWLRLRYASKLSFFVLTGLEAELLFKAVATEGENAGVTWPGVMGQFVSAAGVDSCRFGTDGRVLTTCDFSVETDRKSVV